MLQERAAARGVTLPGKVAPEPKELGQVLTDLHQKPGQLRDMLGGGDVQPRGQASASNPIGDMLASPMAKAVLAGIAAMVVSASWVRGERMAPPRIGGLRPGPDPVLHGGPTLVHSFFGNPLGWEGPKRSTRIWSALPHTPHNPALGTRNRGLVCH